MFRMFALAISLCCLAPVAGQEPKQPDQKPEAVPAPKDAAPRVIEIVPAYPQPGTREVWQNYGIDRRGRFVPRVIYSPAGSFYLQTGEPYPWTTIRPDLFMPYAMD